MNKNIALKIKNMKQLNNLSKSNEKIIAITAAMTVFFMHNPAYAQNILKNAQDALTNLRTELVEKIILVAAAVILLFLAIGYVKRYIKKHTFIKWAIGVVIGGISNTNCYNAIQPLVSAWYKMLLL